MADSWEDEFDAPTVPLAAASNTAPPPSAWDDEDVDENVVESWEEAEVRLKPTPAPSTPSSISATEVKKKRSVAEAIRQREIAEAQRKKEIDEKLSAQKKQTTNEPDNETALERKLRIQKLTIESDMAIARDLFGDDSERPVVKEPAKPTTISLDSFVPKTAADFTKFQTALVSKLGTIEGNALYPKFLEDLVRDLAAPLDFNTVRSLSSILNVIANEKQKASKDTGKGKKKAGASKKPTVRGSVDGTDTTNYGAAYDDEYADFM